MSTEKNLTDEQIEALCQSVYGGYPGLADHDVARRMQAKLSSLKAENEALKQRIEALLDNHGLTKAKIELIAAREQSRELAEAAEQLFKDMQILANAKGTGLATAGMIHLALSKYSSTKQICKNGCTSSDDCTDLCTD